MERCNEGFPSSLTSGTTSLHSTRLRNADLLSFFSILDTTWHVRGRRCSPRSNSNRALSPAPDTAQGKCRLRTYDRHKNCSQPVDLSEATNGISKIPRSSNYPQRFETAYTNPLSATTRFISGLATLRLPNEAPGRVLTIVDASGQIICLDTSRLPTLSAVLTLRRTFGSTVGQTLRRRPKLHCLLIWNFTANA
jgi:hypothetical protein